MVHINSADHFMMYRPFYGVTNAVYNFMVQANSPDLFIVPANIEDNFMLQTNNKDHFFSMQVVQTI